MAKTKPETKDGRMIDFLQGKVRPALKDDARMIYLYLRGGDMGRFVPLNRQDARDSVLRVLK